MSEINTQSVKSGWWKPILLIGLAVALAAAVPGSALALVAGAVFGSVLGVAVLSVASTLGAALCFLIARYIARDSIAGWLADKPGFQKLDRMTEKNGATIVAVTRLIPIFPYNPLNDGFGLTRVSFGAYVLWSWLCRER